jgi:hypothetical protein
MKPMKQILEFCLVLVAFAIPVSAVNDVSIGNYTVNSSDAPISVPIWLNNSNGIASTVVNLDYNPNILNVTQSNNGDFAIFNLDTTKSTKGSVQIMGTTFAVNLFGNNKIGYLNLKPLSCGQSNLGLSIVGLYNWNGSGLIARSGTTANGSFTVTGATCTTPPVPEDTPIILVSAGLLGLVIISRIRKK